MVGLFANCKSQFANKRGDCCSLRPPCPPPLDGCTRRGAPRVRQRSSNTLLNGQLGSPPAQTGSLFGSTRCVAVVIIELCVTKKFGRQRTKVRRTNVAVSDAVAVAGAAARANKNQPVGPTEVQLLEPTLLLEPVRKLLVTRRLV